MASKKVQTEKKGEVYVDLNFKAGSITIGRIRMLKDGVPIIRYTIRYSADLKHKVEAFMDGIEGLVY